MVTDVWPGVCEKCVVPRNNYKSTRKVVKREVVDISLYKPEGLYLSANVKMIIFYVRDKLLVSTYMPTHTPAAVGPQ